MSRYADASCFGRHPARVTEAWTPACYAVSSASRFELSIARKADSCGCIALRFASSDNKTASNSWRIESICCPSTPLGDDYCRRRHDRSGRDRCLLPQTDLVPLVPGCMDHAKETAGGIARMIRPRVKVEPVGLATVRHAVAEFQVHRPFDGDRRAV